MWGYRHFAAAVGAKHEHVPGAVALLRQVVGDLRPIRRQENPAGPLPFDRLQRSERTIFDRDEPNLCRAVNSLKLNEERLSVNQPVVRRSSSHRRCRTGFAALSLVRHQS